VSVQIIRRRPGTTVQDTVLYTSAEPNAYDMTALLTLSRNAYGSMAVTMKHEHTPTGLWKQPILAGDLLIVRVDWPMNEKGRSYLYITDDLTTNYAADKLGYNVSRFPLFVGRVNENPVVDSDTISFTATGLGEVFNQIRPGGDLTFYGEQSDTRSSTSSSFWPIAATTIAAKWFIWQANLFGETTDMNSGFMKRLQGQAWPKFFKTHWKTRAYDQLSTLASDRMKVTFADTCGLERILPFGTGTGVLYNNWQNRAPWVTGMSLNYVYTEQSPRMTYTHNPMVIVRDGLAATFYPDADDKGTTLNERYGLTRTAIRKQTVRASTETLWDRCVNAAEFVGDEVYGDRPDMYSTNPPSGLAPYVYEPLDKIVDVVYVIDNNSTGSIKVILNPVTTSWLTNADQGNSPSSSLLYRYGPNKYVTVQNPSTALTFGINSDWNTNVVLYDDGSLSALPAIRGKSALITGAHTKEEVYESWCKMVDWGKNTAISYFDQYFTHPNEEGFETIAGMNTNPAGSDVLYNEGPGWFPTEATKVSLEPIDEIDRDYMVSSTGMIMTKATPYDKVNPISQYTLWEIAKQAVGRTWYNYNCTTNLVNGSLPMVPELLGARPGMYVGIESDNPEISVVGMTTDQVLAMGVETTVRMATVRSRISEVKYDLVNPENSIVTFGNAPEYKIVEGL